MSRRWKRSTRVAGTVWGLLVLLQVTAFTASYIVHFAGYITTSNAAIDGDQVPINAPATGVLVRWDLPESSLVRPGQVVGRIRLDGSGFTQAEQVVRAPSGGQVAIKLVQEGQRVTAGTTLALAYGSGGIYVTARVPTRAIAAVRLGAPADIAMDAYPEATITGRVSEIQPATAGVFSLYPSSDQNLSNPQRIKEWVAVRIIFNGTGGAALRPGLNVTVRIRRS